MLWETYNIARMSASIRLVRPRKESIKTKVGRRVDRMEQRDERSFFETPVTIVRTVLTAFLITVILMGILALLIC